MKYWKDRATKNTTIDTINLNQEWDFVIGKTHSERPSRTNLAKREILFALQILLCKIELATEINERCFLGQSFAALKKIYG